MKKKCNNVFFYFILWEKHLFVELLLELYGVWRALADLVLLPQQLHPLDLLGLGHDRAEDVQLVHATLLYSSGGKS